MDTYLRFEVFIVGQLWTTPTSQREVTVETDVRRRLKREVFVLLLRLQNVHRILNNEHERGLGDYIQVFVRDEFQREGSVIQTR